MAGSEYLIEIAAKLAGVNDATAQLTAVADRLSGVGNAAATFDTAITSVSSQLATAATAASSANSALATAETKYSALERAANNAAKAVEKAAAGGKATASALGQLEINAAIAADAVEREAGALDKARTAASSAATAHTKLGASLKNLEAAARSEAAAMGASNKVVAKAGFDAENVGEGFGKLGGPLGRVGKMAADVVQGFGKLGGSMGGAGVVAAGAAVAVVALVAAVIAVAAAIGVAIVKTAIWAVGLANANRSAALTVEALVASDKAFAGLASALPAIASQTGLTSAELQGLAKELSAAGVTAAAMPAALKAVAQAESALGKGGAAKFIEELKAGKKTVGEVAQEIETKFGGIVAKKILGLDEQAAKLKSNISGTFGGLDIEPLLVGLTSLVALFDKNTASGRIMKAVFETVFQPMIDAATAAIPVVKAFLVGVAVGALKLYIAFKPAVKVVKELFGQTDTGGLPSALAVATVLGKGLAVAIALVVITIAVLVAAAYTVIAPFIQIASAAGRAWQGIKDGAASVKAYLSGVSLASIGTAMIQGLADGITGAGSKVLDAMIGVVTNAIGAAKSKLDAHSPSRVFEKLGGFTATGFAKGIEGGSDLASGAMEEMVAAPDAGGAGKRGGGHVFHITVIAPDGSAGGIVSGLEAMLTRILEGDVTQAGGPEPEPI